MTLRSAFCLRIDLGSICSADVAQSAANSGEWPAGYSYDDQMLASTPRYDESAGLRGRVMNPADAVKSAAVQRLSTAGTNHAQVSLGTSPSPAAAKLKPDPDAAARALPKHDAHLSASIIKDLTSKGSKANRLLSSTDSVTNASGREVASTRMERLTGLLGIGRATGVAAQVVASDDTSLVPAAESRPIASLGMHQALSQASSPQDAWKALAAPATGDSSSSTPPTSRPKASMKQRQARKATSNGPPDPSHYSSPIPAQAGQGRAAARSAHGQPSAATSTTKEPATLTESISTTDGVYDPAGDGDLRGQPGTSSEPLQRHSQPPSVSSLKKPGKHSASGNSNSSSSGGNSHHAPGDAALSSAFVQEGHAQAELGNNFTGISSSPAPLATRSAEASGPPEQHAQSMLQTPTSAKMLYEAEDEPWAATKADGSLDDTRDDDHSGSSDIGRKELAQGHQKGRSSVSSNEGDGSSEQAAIEALVAELHQLEDRLAVLSSDDSSGESSEDSPAADQEAGEDGDGDTRPGPAGSETVTDISARMDEAEDGPKDGSEVDYPSTRGGVEDTEEDADDFQTASTPWGQDSGEDGNEAGEEGSPRLDMDVWDAEDSGKLLHLAELSLQPS